MSTLKVALLILASILGVTGVVVVYQTSTAAVQPGDEPPPVNPPGPPG